MRFIVASIAALALLLLIARVSQAQAIEGRTCVPGEAIRIEGTGPARTPLLLRFGGRAVGGGVSDAAGAYRLTLQMGQERPGDHLVVVEVRATGEELQRLRCTVPGAPTSRPASSPAAPTATPRPGAPTATITATARPTTTPNPSPTFSTDSTACAQEYPDFCIPPPPPDLNCTAIPYTDFRVLEPDPHGLDGNNNGRGCEASDR